MLIHINLINPFDINKYLSLWAVEKISNSLFSRLGKAKKYNKIPSKNYANRLNKFLRNNQMLLRYLPPLPSAVIFMANLMICCSCLKLVDFLPMPIIFLLEIMLIEERIALKLLYCCWLLRLDIKTGSPYFEEITSLESLHKYMAFMINVSESTAP